MARTQLLDDLTVGRIGRHVARLNGERIALDDGEEQISYAELDRMADALAASFRDMGVNAGDRVSVFLPNCIEYVVTVLAVSRAGAVFSPLNPRFKMVELTPILEQAQPRAVVVDAPRRAILEDALAAAGHDSRIVSCESAPGGDAVAWWSLREGNAPAPADVAETDYFSLMFTSGTTGQPKGVLATHRARMLWVLNACILYRLNEDDAYVGTMPLAHSAGLTFTLMHLYVGGTVHILREFSPAAYLDLVERQGITSSLVVPTMLVMVLEELRRHDPKPDLSSVQRLVTCGSPLQESTKEEVLREVTTELYDYYGSTESNSMTVLKPRHQRQKPGSVGQPFSNVRLRIVDDDGTECPPGERGHVQCRNPSLMDRYLLGNGAPPVTEDGWFDTGDLGHLDEDGFLYLIGRDVDMIFSGGMNLYPAEIESVLMNHPDVLDCTVLGAPDPVWGQTVAAYVVPRGGREVTLDQLQEHCKKSIADYKKPRILKIVSSIPKNAGGKTMKSQLRLDD